MEYVIGLDIGSSSVKVGLFGLDGSLAAMAGRRYPTYESRPGFKEQDAADWWSAAAGAIREITAETPAGSILALGAVGHISSLTFLDDAHAPIRRSLGFQDVRAAAEVSELYASFSREELAGQLGIDLPPGPTWPLPRLLWFSRYEPATIERARVLLQAKDYVNLRLTGVLASDASSNRGMVNLATGRAPERVFRMLRLPDLLPRIYEPHAVIGVVTAEAAAETGLRPGLPVMAGWNDLNGAVLGSGAVDPGDGFNVTGTSEHIGVVTDATPRAPELVCGPYLPGKKLFYGVTSCGGGSLEWFRQFTGESLEQLLAEAERSGPGALLFLPYLEGERAPVWDPRASGALVGLRSSHRPGAVARAILEGVAFSLRQNLEIVERSFSCGPRPLAISGGASRIAFWNQIKADVLERPIITLQNPQAGMLGAAMLAAAGAGIHGSPEDAARRMARPGSRFDPRMNESQRYARLYAQYRELYPALRGVLAALDEERTLCGTNMPEKNALIFSGGKIARGFLAHLLTLSGYRLTFVEKNAELAQLLRERGRYRVHIMGAPEKSIEIAGFGVLDAKDVEAVAAAVADASVILVSIGGPNLPQVAAPLAAGLRRRRSGVNILLAENYFQPAQWLRGMIAERLTPEEREWFAREVGIVETLVLRSTIEPTDDMKAEDPLCLKAQDMWELPADKAAFKGDIPPIQGLAPQDNFQGGLVRKLFTYNAINAVIAYNGYLKGYELLADAANDPELVELARAAARESSAALCARYGFDPEEQRRFAESAIAKYQKREIVDPIERNARDPLRKLSRHDRLTGPACLALEQGIVPQALSRGIAAAMLYDHAGDPAAVRLQEIIRAKGVRGAISELCGAPAEGALADLVSAAYEQLERSAKHGVSVADGKDRSR